eukprot:CAMPEP_0115004032 /NCGR_PEP_ID=MMETSP0216-20121206/18967_1 /TAXON_ID=223996 /ORGANISM="Protocruzia adherens, Strain Boccale" /LENGTH=298 /DNA_ID=CAMNT_0002369955 /DNA_START=66 /DNA_END=962 /DNA_ORIENTATION=+
MEAPKVPTRFQILKTRIVNTINDPEKMLQLVEKNRGNLRYYLFFIIFIITSYNLVSDGDFSFFLTLCSAIQMFSFCLIGYKIRRSGTCSGLSKQTLITYMVVHIARLSSTLLYEGYLPYDSSGDWFYQAVEVIGFLLNGLLLWYVCRTYKESYDGECDVLNCLGLMVPCAVLAVFLHPSLNRNFATDVAWTFALYLEAVALLPQLVMFQKKGGYIEEFTSHFVATQGIAKFFAFIFWFSCYQELNEENAKSASLTTSYIGHVVVLFQLIPLLLIGDYLWLYAKSIYNGIPLQLDVIDV